MNKNPKFSIIVPVYNVQAYLSYCVDTLINQTLRDIEIIFINDGSKDKSLEILNQYAQIDKRIKIIDQKNAGSSEARNVGLDKATGDYILFVDSDDILNKNACERLYLEVLQTNADMVVFGTNIFPWIQDYDNGWLYTYLNVNFAEYNNNSIKALFSEKASKPFIWNKCYRRSIIEENKIRFCKELSLGEDSLFLFTVYPKLDKVIYLPDKLYNYRCERDGSLMSASRKDVCWKLTSHLEIIRKVLEEWHKSNCILGNEENLYEWSLDLIANEWDSAILTSDEKRKIKDKFFDIIDNYKIRKKVKKDTIKLEKKLLRN